jgi:hypothetical protein
LKLIIWCLKALKCNNKQTANDTDDSKIRLYELAMSCTGEYALFIDGATTDADKSHIMAQMVITMTRVNGVYERIRNHVSICA